MTHTQNLLSQKQVVENFLADTPEDEILERNSWLARLQSLNAQIEVEQKRVVPVRSAITFTGPPVVASYGIASTFGMAATRAYTKIVQVVAAQWFNAQPLAQTRPLKADSKFDLLVVGPALGSFGFELEEPSEEQLTFEERTVLTQSVYKIQSLLQSTLASDDELTDAIADLDERVLAALRAFIEVLNKNDSICAITTAQSEFRFESEAQVARSRARLEVKNIVREEVTLEGEFEGLLPTPRTFEFKIAQSGEVVVGKVNPAVADIADINQKLNMPARVRAISHRVGNGRPRYVLVQNPEWLAETKQG